MRKRLIAIFIERFGNHPKLSGITTFKDLVRIFNEPCEVVDGKITIRKNPGGNAMVNPSDPDASIDNKGTGYQVQVSETFHPDNPVQIITAALPQTASVADQSAVAPMLDKMAAIDARPTELLADSGYGADDNVHLAAQQGVELIAPTTGKNAQRVGQEECQLDDAGRITACPCGKRPLVKRYDDGKGRAVFAAATCENCPLRKRCSASKQGLIMFSVMMPEACDCASVDYMRRWRNFVKNTGIVPASKRSSDA